REDRRRPQRDIKSGAGGPGRRNRYRPRAAYASREVAAIQPGSIGRAVGTTRPTSLIGSAPQWPAHARTTGAKDRTQCGYLLPGGAARLYPRRVLGRPRIGRFKQALHGEPKQCFVKMWLVAV